MSHALVPAALGQARAHESDAHPAVLGTLSVIFGALALTALAQITIPLPWTPVPITGQTFGVSLLGLLYGRKLAFAAVAAYLGAGLLGAPVLAGHAALHFGATTGYLIGMVFAAGLIGTLADRGWTNGWWSALAATYAGSVCTYVGGVFVLSYFLPTSALLAAGVLPFMIGDLIKNAAAVTIARAAHRSRQH